MAASNRGIALSGIKLRSRNSRSQWTHALVHDPLGNDQQGQRHQKADVYFHVQKERYGRTSAAQLTFQSGEHQERQPGNQSR